MVICLTVSAVLPLSDLSVGAEIAISASGNVSSMVDFSNVFKISLDVNLTASLVPVSIIKYFGCFRMIRSTAHDVVSRQQKFWGTS